MEKLQSVPAVASETSFTEVKLKKFSAKFVFIDPPSEKEFGIPIFQTLREKGLVKKMVKPFPDNLTLHGLEDKDTIIFKDERTGFQALYTFYETEDEYLFDADSPLATEGNKIFLFASIAFPKPKEEVLGGTEASNKLPV